MLNIAYRNQASAKTGDTRKPWEWMLIDSAIIGGISLFTELVAGPPSWMGLYKAAMAFGLAFFIQLAVERGLRKVSQN